MPETDTAVDFEGEAMLLENAREGSGAALSQLVQRHRDAVHVIARNLLVATADVAAVTQDVFETAFRTLRSKPRHRPFKTWLWGITVEKALLKRSVGCCSVPGSLDAFLPRFDGDGRLLPTAGRWPAVGVPLQHDLTLALREALEFIDEPTRAAFVVRDVLDLSVDDAAAVLDTSPEEIRRRAHRARLLLRGLVEGLL